VGNPLTVSVTGALKLEFGVVVKLTLLEPPGARLTELSPATRVNAGAGATVIVSGADPVIVPLVAETLAE
jgi:hypothetical protein